MRAPSMRRELLLLREMRDAAATIRELVVSAASSRLRLTDSGVRSSWALHGPR